MNLEQAEQLKNEILGVLDNGHKGTLRVTFYGGPGTGKSTTNALVFGRLKQRGLNVEMSHEYAKDLVWEKRDGALGFQPYIIAKQLWREKRLDGQVDAILTDTSTLFSFIYGTPDNGVTPAFKNWVIDEYRAENRLDFFLERDYSREYDPNGRTQKTIEEAAQADRDIRKLINHFGLEVVPIQVDTEGNGHIDTIAKKIESVLGTQGTLDLQSNYAPGPLPLLIKTEFDCHGF
jgi:hypothetical protein